VLIGTAVSKAPFLICGTTNLRRNRLTVKRLVMTLSELAFSKLKEESKQILAKYSPK
jgi:hypothetical protein